MDAACGGECEAECDGNSTCLDVCYGSCTEQSDACWGIQGQGSYCIYCSYGGQGFNLSCWYECWVGGGGYRMCELSNGCGYYF